MALLKEKIHLHLFVISSHDVCGFFYEIM